MIPGKSAYTKGKKMFRFGNYEDVLIEGNGYLYVCNEVYGWAHLYCVRDYSESLIMGETSGADWEYINNLEPAPVDIALKIIELETNEYLKYSTEMDEDERAEYIESKLSEYMDIE